MNNYVLGLELLIIGMGTVFLSLYLLSVFLYFSGKLFGPESENKKKAKKAAETSKAELEKKDNQIDKLEQGFSSKKAAAVTAAVYEMLNDQKNYRIISIQKSNQNWKR
ncbi:MAG: OadG family transporter subunit [Halanaerobium sp.]